MRSAVEMNKLSTASGMTSGFRLLDSCHVSDDLCWC